MYFTSFSDDGAHDEGEDELGEEHHAGHDGDIGPNPTNLYSVFHD